jgi:hypothetical protein
MSIERQKPRLCDVPHCGRPCDTRGWSHLCSKHSARAYNNGGPLRSGIRETDYRVYNLWCAEGLAKYRNTKATEAALKIAETILTFTAIYQFRYYLELERMMQLMRDDQVSATDVLHRVCLHVAFVTANPGRYGGDQNSERLALARCVMRLIPLKRYGKRWTRRSLLLLAEHIMEDGLYLYALRLIDRMKADDAAKLALKEQSLDLDTPAEAPTDDTPRAGRAHRCRRGIVGA